MLPLAIQFLEAVTASRGGGARIRVRCPPFSLFYGSHLSLCLFFDEDNRHIGLGQTLNFNLITSPKILFPVDVNLGDII